MTESPEERAQRIYQEECVHPRYCTPPSNKADCALCLADEIRAAANDALERAAKKVQWKASTIGIINRYSNGCADAAGRDLATTIRGLKDE